MALLFCFCGLRILVYYYVHTGCLQCSRFHGCCLYSCPLCICIKMFFFFKYGIWCEYIFDNVWAKKVCSCETLFFTAWTEVLRYSRLLVGESYSQRWWRLLDHTAGRQPGSYWREHDDPVNYKGDITQVNLMLQTHWDVVNWLCNLQL